MPAPGDVFYSVTMVVGCPIGACDPMLCPIWGFRAITAHVTPPPRSCSSALAYSCGPEQTVHSGNATMCDACLAKRPVQHMLAQYNCSRAAQAAFCSPSGGLSARAALVEGAAEAFAVW